VVRSQEAADRAIRPKLRLPGHPKFQRAVEAVFWAEIAKGMLPIEAAAVAGVAPRGRPALVPQRWRHGAVRPDVEAHGPVSVLR
jgi:transposase, IS30 family